MWRRISEITVTKLQYKCDMIKMNALLKLLYVRAHHYTILCDLQHYIYNIYTFPVLKHAIHSGPDVLSYHTSCSVLFNPFTTGRMPVCGCCFKSDDNIIVYIVTRNIFFKYFEKMFPGSSR